MTLLLLFVKSVSVLLSIFAKCHEWGTLVIIGTAEGLCTIRATKVGDIRFIKPWFVMR
jgi:hypothetical protein